MIQVIFTIDYEIYGNGEGSLRDLVYEPTRRLMRLFEEAGVKFVCFVETAEFERIEALRTDSAVQDVRCQIRELHQNGFEIGLHLHPQWYNASFRNGRWSLDYDEYNLCTLPEERITRIVNGAIAYLRNVLGQPDFTPLSFRAGNWLFQPTRTAGNVLAASGIKIDSSVFKGGRQHEHQLDYRPARRNGPYWTFRDDVNVPDSTGPLLEVPIHTEMVPWWKMITKKRVGLQTKGIAAGRLSRQRFSRLRNYARLRHPLKFDFCRMTFDELVSMTDRALDQDRNQPELFRPMVAIGHSKDLVDFDTIAAFLSHLATKGVAVSTFHDVFSQCHNGSYR